MLFCMLSCLHFICLGVYIAPEIYRNDTFDRSVDTFAFGLILYEVCKTSCLHTSNQLLYVQSSTLEFLFASANESTLIVCCGCYVREKVCCSCCQYYIQLSTYPRLSIAHVDYLIILSYRLFRWLKEFLLFTQSLERKQPRWFLQKGWDHYSRINLNHIRRMWKSKWRFCFISYPRSV